jgi:hypothetical protein
LFWLVCWHRRRRPAKPDLKGLITFGIAGSRQDLRQPGMNVSMVAY